MKICKDPQLSAVLNYKPLPFEQDCTIDGFVIRVIEMYRLFELRSQITLLGSLVPDVKYTPPSYDEINLLISAGLSYYNQLSAKVVACEDKINSHQEEIKAALSDSKVHGGVESAKRIIEILKHREAKANEEKLVHQQSMNDQLRMVALLRKVVEGADEETKSLINFSELNKLKSAPPFTARFTARYGEPDYNRSPDAKEYAWRMMDDYEKALRDIIKKVSLSTDKFEISRGRNELAAFYSEYFGLQGNDGVKMSMTSDEYAEMKFSIYKQQASKRNKMRS